jgi:cytochrome c-type biogenesis protein CcmE
VDLNERADADDIGRSADEDAPETSGAPATAVDLTPRPVTPAAKTKKRKVGPPLMLAGLLVVAAALVFQFLTNATLYFCNADEVGVRAECKGDKTFRLQGTVDKGSVQSGVPLRFTVSYNGRVIPVTYGDANPGGIFREGIPVVIEGKMVGETFNGTNILVKHSEKYREQNPDRVKDYNS